MSAHPFRQVDVFGAGAFSGNPVAVVHDATDLSDDQMAAISDWTNLSECTFLLPPTSPEADYRVRIFSLRAELPFAGHPTLGTAAAWLDAGGTPARSDVVVQECGVGLVPVRRDGAVLAFSAPPMLRSGPVDPDDLAEAARVLGIPVDSVVDAAWIDNGPGWMGLLLESAEAVLSLTPTSDGASRFIGVAGPHPAGADAALEVRAFFSAEAGVLREDPVTGSLNASLAQWLTASGRMSAPYVAAQGTALGRSGRVHVDGGGATLWVGGRTHVAIRGVIDA